MTVGFLGLGHMGEPMATRLVTDDVDLVVWTRTTEKAADVVRRGAALASSPAEVFDRCDPVLLMLANDRAIDEVLGRSEHGFRVSVEGRTVVNMGTVSPSYSAELGAQLDAHGAAYVEAPVSGSRVPAQNGELVVMLAGDPAAIARVETSIAPMTAATFQCGAVPRALETKLAVNVFLISLVCGLAESVAFAERCGVELALLRRVLDAGQMASPVSRIKLAKLADDDLAAQAAVSDVLYNNRLILDTARDRGAEPPLLAVCADLLVQAESLGLGKADMISVVEAERARMARGRPLSG